MERRRYSRQRELIYQALASTSAHPTAEMLFQMLKPEHPKLSLGTVYRNLNQLAEDGVIVRLPLRVERYDALMHPHSHFCCERCQQVQDVDLTFPEEHTAVEAELGVTVRREVRVFFGICRDCRAELE